MKDSEIILGNVDGSLLVGMNNGRLELPFNNNIYLLTVPIAGINYYIRYKDLIISNGDKLILKREPNNNFDTYAIEVFTQNEIKLGYIPRRNNKVFARLMDGGKRLYAEVREVQYYFDEINEIVIRIFMNDI
ncbi:HIRAN domain-containing protein [Clostridium paridis]|uniref:HIRAN domain-containing protein n=1 Tax=Clostridium paridis TaxID=2803863 RepID=A0A937K501_9CLOT|nr:HIRAN domain-containing protein [Clostridium paridis]